ncbi:MAG TPA: hypothetical protein VE975_05525 [Actinomycetota bacterium]|jgi:hypothetical protein|nr:hypothetical protein [Actinomycetota bacterium]
MQRLTVAQELRVAVVSKEAHVRLQAARAFDMAPAAWSVELFDRVPDDYDVLVLGPDVSEPPPRQPSGAAAVRFDPARPEDLIQQVGRAGEPRSAGRVVAVTGTGGGVGVTTVALHLAQALAKFQESPGVACVDLDLRFRGTSARMGLDPSSLKTYAPGDDTLLSSVPVSGGFRLVLPDPAGGRPSELHAVRQTFGVVVVDVPAGEALPEETDAAVIIMPGSRVAAARAARLLEDISAPAALVVNRLGWGGDLTRSALERLAGHRLAVELPCCASLRDSEDDGRLLRSGWTRWERRLGRLARTLAPNRPKGDRS